MMSGTIAYEYVFVDAAIVLLDCHYGGDPVKAPPSQICSLVQVDGDRASDHN